MPNYGEKKYWEERYESQKGKTFDWLEDYESIKPILDNLGIKKEYRILNVGCGNSEFSEKMYDEGFTHNYNIDICQNVIDFMNTRNKGKKGLHFDVMDVCEMAYKDETFDLIIDKSTIDALLCSDHSFMIVAKMLKEISRVLKTGGYYVIISYGQPENRMIHLERDHLAFDIQIYTIKRQDDDEKDKEKIHYVYICKKLPEAVENLNNFDLVYKELEQEELEGAEDDEADLGENNADNEAREEYLPPEDDKRDINNIKDTKDENIH
jgi:ubiquinone/menaquinone biosynthesis C-methylase UbiE